MSLVYFLRHGETDWNLKRIAQGKLDIPLNDTGREQARAAAEVLRDTAFTTIVSSPLGRAHETAKAVAAFQSATMVLDADLMEIGLGVIEGQAGEDFGEAFERLWAGGPAPEGGETMDEFTGRCLRGFEAAIKQPGPVLIVAHGGVWRALTRRLPVSPEVRAANATPFKLTSAAKGWSVEVLSV